MLAPLDHAYQSAPLAGREEGFGVSMRSVGIVSDLSSQILPWQKAVRYAYAHGEWPLWNPFMLCGDILAASASSAPYSPVFLLGLLLPLPESLTFQVALAFFLAALSAFLFARELECREAAALVAAAGWMLSAFLAFFLRWPLGHAVACYPLVLLGVHRAFRQPGLGSAGLLAAALTAVLLAGHPESALHVVFLGLAFAAGCWWIVRPERPLATVATGLGAGLVALALAAVFVLPIVEALPQSAEYWGRRARAETIDRSRSPVRAAQALLPDWVPFVYGPPGEAAKRAPFRWVVSDTAYCGSVLVAPALLGLLASRRRERFLLAGLGALGALAGVDAPGVAEAVGRLPLLDIAINERLTFAAACSLVLLAALGLEAWCERRAPERLAWLSLGTAAALGGALALLWPWMREMGLPQGFLWPQAVWLVAPPALLGAFLLTRPSWRLGLLAVLAALVLQRAADVRTLYPAFPGHAFYPTVPPLDRLPKKRPPFRVVGLGSALTPNSAALFEIEDPRGYQAMHLRRLAHTLALWSEPRSAWFNRVDDLERPFLAFLNVRYAVTPPGAPVPRGWRIAGTGAGGALLRNPRALDRAFVPRRVRMGGRADGVLAEMAEETDFRRRAWISRPGSAPTATPRGRPNGPGRVEVRRRGLGYELDATMERPGWVVVSVTAWKGWRAFAAGEELPVAFANHAFLAVRAPEGESEIRLVYRPRAFVIGRALSLTTLGGLLLLATVRAGRRRLRRSPS